MSEAQGTDHTRRADASPTKAFFVRMLTRDISLDDCILDLIDNSIDSAWTRAGMRPEAFSVGDSLSRFEINITFSEADFEIRDNCGGISLDDAANYAFTFGRTADAHTDDFTVGVYGIGMKRAVFKIGDDIAIRSTNDNGDSVDSFEVPIQVPAWLADESVPWDFDITAKEDLPEPGVHIQIRDLSEEAARQFSDPTYESVLIQTLSRDYLLPLMQGLIIRVNNQAVPSRPIKLLESDAFQPMREVAHDRGVTVEVIAGMHAPPPEDNEPESSRQDRTSGWFIVCNGRVVLAADRSTLTGWGVADFPRWHAQYSGFVGMVLFTAANPALLPMTTTKRSVNASSPLYQRTLNRMFVPAREWITYTNQRKASLDDARRLESVARPVDVAAVPNRSAVALPRLTGSRSKVANVNYSVDRSRMRALASALGDPNLSFREVGLKSFDYTYEAQVDE